MEELADRSVEDKLQADFLSLRATMLVWSWVYMLLKTFLEEGLGADWLQSVENRNKALLHKLLQIHSLFHKII